MGLERTWLIRPLGVELLLLLDIDTNLCFLKTNCGYRIPSYPEAFPIQISKVSQKC